MARTKVPPNAIIHYNMLRAAKMTRGEAPQLRIGCSLRKDRTLHKILRSEHVQQFVVLVAPIDELLERIQQRTIIERHMKSEYDRKFWLEAIRRIDLVHLYDQLFELIEEHEIPYRLLYSSGRNGETRFKPSERALLRDNLRGHYVVPQAFQS